MLKVNCGCDGAPQAQLLLIHHGPEILVNIGFDETWNHKSNLPPKPGASQLKALIDTGARESCIDDALARRLTLPHIDRRSVCSVKGTFEVDYHRAQIHVPALRFTLRGLFAVLPLIDSGFKFHALLGRSFLSNIRMEYDGKTGKVELALSH
jgi:predicted aspartyl protease